MSRAPSRCLSALCPLFLSSSTSHHPARNIPTRHGRMSPFAPPAASQGKQAGLGSLAPAAGGARPSCAAQPTPHIPDLHLAGSHSRAGGEGGGVGKKRQVGCVEASAKELCGEQNRQKSAPQFHPCHPLRSFTASPLPELHSGGDTDPKGPPHPCCHPPASPGGGQRSHRHVLGCWLSFFCPCRTIASTGGWVSSGWLVQLCSVQLGFRGFPFKTTNVCL